MSRKKLITYGALTIGLVLLVVAIANMMKKSGKEGFSEGFVNSLTDFLGGVGGGKTEIGSTITFGPTRVTPKKDWFDEEFVNSIPMADRSIAR